jgi:hypothetical protein
VFCFFFFGFLSHSIFGYLLSNRRYFTTDGQSVSQSVSMSWCRTNSGTCDQILLPVGRLLSKSCGLVSVGRPLWRQDESVVCSAITQLFKSRRTRNHTLLSLLRLPQPGGPVSRIYILQEQGRPVISPGTGFPLRRLLRLAGLQWRYSNPLPTWRARSLYIYLPKTGWASLKSRYDRGQSISMSWCLVHEALEGCTWTNFNLILGGVFIKAM